MNYFSGIIHIQLYIINQERFNSFMTYDICIKPFYTKLRDSKHFYIDGTFLYPKVFSQLIVILYIDDKSGKRYPGLYALINNKKEEGYKYLFKK